MDLKTPLSLKTLGVNPDDELLNELGIEIAETWIDVTFFTIDAVQLHKHKDDPSKNKAIINSSGAEYVVNNKYSEVLKMIEEIQS